MLIVKRSTDVLKISISQSSSQVSLIDTALALSARGCEFESVSTNALVKIECT